MVVQSVLKTLCLFCTLILQVTYFLVCKFKYDQAGANCCLQIHVYFHKPFYKHIPVITLTSTHIHSHRSRKLLALYYLSLWKCQDTIMCSCIVVFAQLTFGISFILCLRCQQVQCYGNVHFDKPVLQLDRQGLEQ